MKDKINSTLETLLSKIYTEKNIIRGDITPEQIQKWDSLVDDISELFMELIEQNR